ncbi:hypothetical protein ABZP36_006818 [Zizania latifolia]
MRSGIWSIRWLLTELFELFTCSGLSNHVIEAEEEYGFPSGACGPVALPCDEVLFELVLRHLSSPSSAAWFVTLEDLQRGTLSCCSAAGEAVPLLRGIATDKAVW